MKNICKALIVIILFISACSNAPKVEIISAKFIDKINVNDVSWTFKDETIASFEMNIYFANDLAPDLETNSKEHRAKVFKKLVENFHFYVDNKEIKNIWGYWPQKSGKNFAESMTVFYRVPKNRVKNSLKLICDGTVLGFKDYKFIYTELQ